MTDTIEERLARVEQAVADLKEYVMKELNHTAFYQKLILMLLAATLTAVGLGNLVQYITH